MKVDNNNKKSVPLCDRAGFKPARTVSTLSKERGSTSQERAGHVLLSRSSAGRESPQQERRATTKTNQMRKGVDSNLLGWQTQRVPKTAKQGATAQTTPPFRVSQKPCPLVWWDRWLLPFGDCGSLVSCHPAMVERVQRRRPKNRPGVKGMTRTPRWHPEEDLGNCHTKPTRGTLEPAWAASVKRGVGAQRLCEREGAQRPWRRGATGYCWLSRQPLVTMRQPFRLFRRLGLQKETVSCQNDVHLLPEQFVEQVVTWQLRAVLTVFAHVPSRNGFCLSHFGSRPFLFKSPLVSVECVRSGVCFLQVVA